MAHDIIKRLYRSKLDIENLSRLRTLIASEIDPFDYTGVVVSKPWGYEYLMYENPHVAIWILYIKKDHATSMHCHPNKKSSLVVLSGSVVCSNLEGWVARKAGEGLIIEEAVFHATRATSSKGALVMEIESPPNKKDLVRLKDEYGREREGYESEEKMSRKLSDYEYVDFHGNNFDKRVAKKLGDCMLSVCSHKVHLDVDKKLGKEKGSIICLLKGKIHDAEGNILVGAGEAESLSQVQARSPLIAFGDIQYLIITFHEKKGKNS